MRKLVFVLGGLLLAPLALAASYASIDGAACVDPPLLRCPVDGCPPDRVIHQGPVVEMKTRRSYFLDYPCDLAPGEPVTVVLNLHGGGSYGNWQRHYFPLVDHVGEYRLVVATPGGRIRALAGKEASR
jgi:poly(3-hydroxybutyrate) depolymerase